MKLVIGTAQFGMNYGIANTNGQVSFKEIIKILDYANLKGIDTLDTAKSYESACSQRRQYRWRAGRIL